VADEEDFGDSGWGNPSGDEGIEADDPWAEPTSSHTAKASISYDDGGEPDFEGWLNAQARAKSSKKPLPKGLAKKNTPAIPSLTKSSLPPKKPTAAAPKAAPSTTKAPAKSKPAPAPAEEDDWGDAWE
jgi:SCY1-like protein 1